MEDFDLEELESRLYSQVYHSIEENEVNPISENAMDHVPPVTSNVRKHNRYFQNKVQSQTYISLDQSKKAGQGKETSTSKIQNDFTFDSNSTTIITSNSTDKFHNNITVNQFTVPVIINPDRTLISQPGEYFTSWSKESLKLMKLPKRDKKKLKYRTDKPKQLNEVTIFLSDDSDDCVIVEENKNTNSFENNRNINTEFPKKYDEIKGGKRPESDDDIIYIPPAPIEVIDIEENEMTINSPIILGEKSSIEDISKECTIENQLNYSSNLEESRDLVKTPESNASNDFLEHPLTDNIATDFNFGLHGPDFNNSQGDFVRPSTKPVEYCETESSCSTNEHNRDFSNTVKTIVFDEVEFPKEDIFSEKNLESFSSFITPKRNTNSSKEVSTNQNPKVICENKQDHKTSSDDTSSESDYDHSIESNKLRIIENDPKYKNLPHLSLMTHVEETPRKSVSKRLTAKSFFQSVSKIGLEKIENSPISEDRNNPLKKKQRKKKRKSSHRVIINSEDDDDDDDDDQYLSGCNEENTENKNRRSDCACLSNVSDSNEKSPSPSKQKRKKRNSVTSEINQNISDNESIISFQEKSKKKKKMDILVAENSLENEAKAGSGECEADLTTDPKEENYESQNIDDDKDVDEEEVIETTISPEKFKKKKRKSAPEILQNDLGFEVSEGTAEKLKKKKKKRDSTSEKLLPTEMEQQISVEDTVLATNGDPLENKINDSSLITENSSEPVTSEIIQNKSASGIELIVIDDTENNSEVQVITFSDSESDSNFHNLEDIGDNVTLANCFSSIEVTVEKKSTGRNICDSEIFQGTAAFEEFDVDRIQREQSDDPEKWKISHKDRATYWNKDVNKGPRCNRCRHFGHIALKCTEKPEPPSCFLCGQRDHREPRCPNKRCTQCGNPGDYSTIYCWKCFKFRHSVCRLCKMKGHVENKCPDVWRRYHSTTTEGPIVVSHGQLKPRYEQWCSGCARQGHLEHECNNYNREYPPTTPYIIKYEDNLAQDKNKLTQSNVANEDSQECVPRNSDDSAPSTSSAHDSAFYQPTIDALLMSNQLAFPNQQPNPLSVLGLLPPTNQIAYLNQVVTPYTLKFLSQLPVLSQLQTMAIINKQNVVPNPVNHNFINENPNRVLNPCFVPNGSSTLSSVNPTNEYYLDNTKITKVINDREIKEIILSASFSVVKDFLTNQMEELRSTDIQPRFLKNKLYKYDKMNSNKKSLSTKFLREKSYWFRILNMFIFGKHKIGDGQLHVNYLNKYLAHPKKSQLDDHKRRSLLSSYSYIFTHDKHKNVNYYKWINILIQKYEKGTINKLIL